MQINDYQTEAMKTRMESADLTYAMFGLSGEVGELHSHLAKRIRDEGEFEMDVVHACKELGDILWFVAAIADDMGLTLSDVADMNLKKLKDRQSRNVLTGSGDNR